MLLSYFQRGIVVLALICSTGSLQAQTFFGTSGSNTVEATFSITGGNLDIVLSNTSTTAATGNADVLTGLFFNASGNPTFDKSLSSIDTNGSTFVNTGTNSPTGTIGDHWAYKGSLTGTTPTPPGNANYGVSAVGLGIFGPTDTFTGTGPSPNGVDYGLVGPGGPGSVGGNQGPQLQNSVHIVLSNSLTGTETIGNVWFQFGSDLSEPSVQGTPAPPALLTALLGAVMPGLGLVSRRLRRQTTAS